jgi:hypothetical protein
MKSAGGRLYGHSPVKCTGWFDYHGKYGRLHTQTEENQDKSHLVQFPDQNQTGDLPNTSQKRYCFNQLAG